MSVNFADVFDAVGQAIEPDAPAVLCDGEVTTWGEFDRRSNALARALLAAGLGGQAKVGLYMRNGPDYLMAFAACLKASLVPVNINGEVAGFGSLASAYGEDARPLELARDRDDVFLFYTGGTTGLPKGAMWPSGALWGALAASRAPAPGAPAPTTLGELAAQIRSGEGRVRYNIPPTLMHGTGLFAALQRGGSVACPGRTSFEPDAVVREDGVRYILGGDHALVEAEGSIRLLGRGSHCINTAGEKVYPEEVEGALKTHPVVVDALVFGLPDPRFGQRVAAVASLRGGAEPDDLVDHVRERLAAYKAPRQIAFVTKVPRAENGKADYAGARARFEAQLGALKQA
jgi:acyl-CoA synthetase (AMP-forming)/AMP-acid ligase II